MTDGAPKAPAGWYPDPEDPSAQRYWDGTSWSAPPPATPTQATEATHVEPAAPGETRKRWHQSWALRALVVIVILALFAAWRAGTFDHALYNIGLNAKPCARNGFGATFCGQELTEYREKIARGKEEGEQEAAKVKRESEEAGNKAREEAEASERKINEETQQRIREGSP